MVSHSLNVSESLSLQFECHSGFHWAKLCFAIWVLLKTNPQALQTFSPFLPSGEMTLPLQLGHPNLKISPFLSLNKKPEARLLCTAFLRYRGSPVLLFLAYKTA